jgi:hypothetical protein
MVAAHPRLKSGDELTFTWNRGKPQRTVSGLPSVSVAFEMAQQSNTSFRCVRTAIFGAPVVPPVQK